MTTSKANATFQIPADAAEVYESKFVPAMFAEWAPPLVDLAGLHPGDAVLDVACGTGIAARTAAKQVGASGSVVGLDLNDAMLDVARRLRPDLDWRQGNAGSLPFPDGSFDAVLCQAALMFFPDPEQALREMGRVLVTGGTVAVQVWGRLQSSPGYTAFAGAVARHAGAESVELFSTYWALGDLDRLAALCGRAGLEVTATRTRLGAATFASIDEFVTTEVESTPLVEQIDDATYRRLREDAEEALQPFLTTGGQVAVPIEGHLVAARVQRR